MTTAPQAETPRTDAEITRIFQVCQEHQRLYVLGDFARRLETETSRLAAALEEAKAIIAIFHDSAVFPLGSVEIGRATFARARAALSTAPAEGLKE